MNSAAASHVEVHGVDQLVETALARNASLTERR